MTVSPLYTLGAALAISVVGTPVVRSLALRWGFVDHPERRKIHQVPVPLLGGLALYLAVVGALALSSPRHTWLGLLGAVAGATWISAFGLWDDRWGLPVASKLGAQVAAAALLIAIGVRVALPIPPALNLALSTLWIVGITNAFNLLDNMDGLAAGAGAISAAGFLVLAALEGQTGLAMLAAALLGACLGFLIYNFRPARIFMGDAGSLFLGFSLAAVGIELRFPGRPVTQTWAIPLLVLGLPILDTTLVFFTRLSRGENPLTTPGRDHISHRLVRRGLSPTVAVVVLYLLAVVLAGLGVAVSRLAPAGAPLVLAAAVLSLAFLVVLARTSHTDKKAEDHGKPS